MKKVLKSSLSLFLAIALIFGSAAVGLVEFDFAKLFAVKANAASEVEDSTSLKENSESYVENEDITMDIPVTDEISDKAEYDYASGNLIGNTKNFMYVVQKEGTCNGQVTFVVYVKAGYSVCCISIRVGFDENALKPVDFTLCEGFGRPKDPWVSGMVVDTTNTYSFAWVTATEVKYYSDKPFAEITFDINEGYSESDILFYCVEFFSENEPSYNIGKADEPLVFCSETIDVTKRHASGIWKTSAEATCTEDGYEYEECSVCGEVLETNIIPSTGHTEVVDVATMPTCTEPGLSEGRHCSVCGEVFVAQTISAPATGHTSSDWIVDREPFCVEDGYKHRECSACGESLEIAVIPGADDHYWYDSTVIVSPTCTEPGTLSYSCYYCQGMGVHKYETIPATGHDYDSAIIDPTCTTDGYLRQSCSNCGDAYISEDIPATGHASSDWIIDLNATCTEDGSKHKECTVCGETLETGTIPATGHTSSDWIVDTNATCTASGSKHKECTVCGETLEIGAIPAIGHTSSNWIVYKEATAGAPGILVKRCTVCGTILERAEIPQLKPSTPKVTTENALTGVLVKWNAVDGAVKYNVYRRQGGYSTWTLVGTTTGTSLTDTKVSSGIYYVYSVRAYNNAGQYSDFASANTNTRKYMAVPKLTGISNATNGLYIKWNPVAGVTNGYRVYRRGAGSTYWTYLGTVKTTYFTDTSVKARSGEYFRYTVIADGGYHSKFDTTGLYLKRLDNPTLKSAVSSKTGITVKWETVVGTTGYYVYRKTANSGWVRIAAVGGTNNTSYVDKTAKKGVTYTYTVRAVYGATTSYFNSGISCKDKY